MRIIRPATKNIELVLGKQRFSKKETYRVSYFCYSFGFEDESILYHSLTGEIISIDSINKTEWFNDPKVMNTLVEKWFLVPKSFNEIKICDEIRTVLKTMKSEDDHFDFFTIFTTTVCNARCFYCFEQGQKKISMDKNIALDVSKWIAKQSRGKDIKIRWFGGEPLCNVNVIDLICNELNKMNVSFSSTIVSNGYLFDSEIIRKAKSLWHLEKIEITLDGTEKQYNKTKNFVIQPNDAYKKVINNIHLLLEAGFILCIHLNMDTSNADDLEKLSLELAERFGKYKNLKVLCRFLVDYNNNVHHFKDSEQAINKLKKINSVLESHGIDTKKNLNHQFRLTSCMADDDRMVTILPDGRIGKCSHYGDSEEVGSIYTSMDKKLVDSWKELLPINKKCETCICYPQCVRLKKCDGFTDECSDLYRSQKVNNLKTYVMDTYYKWKNIEK